MNDSPVDETGPPPLECVLHAMIVSLKLPVLALGPIAMFRVALWTSLLVSSNTVGLMAYVIPSGRPALSTRPRIHLSKSGAIP